MVFGVILAGGVGSRMENTEKPKQYMTIGRKPILIHTLEKFFVVQEFEKIIVLCPNEWVSHTKNMVRKYLPEGDKVAVITGGQTRNETIMNAVDYIEQNYGLQEDTIVVTHDSVRPFVTNRIIMENIQAAKEYGACDTVIPSTDTIVESADGKLIQDIPNRRRMYQGQTPQSFQAMKLKQLYESLSQDEKEILTDAAKIFVMKQEKVGLVDGESFNIKITYPYDLKVAEAMLKGEQ